MAQTKIGWSQLDKPAPLYYRRFLNAYIVCMMPALAGLFSGWGFPDKVNSRLGLLLIFSAAIAKGIGMVLGNGQSYTPSDQVVDAQASKN